MFFELTDPKKEQKKIFNPVILSAQHASIYVAISSIYVFVSSMYGAKIASSTESLMHIEIIKGLLFICCSGMFFFFCSWRLLKRIEKNEVEILIQKNILIKSEQRAMAGIFASSIAHDMNNSLTILKGYISLLETEDNVSENIKDTLQIISKAAEDLSRLAKQLVESGKEGTPGNVKNTELVSLLRDTCQSVNSHVRGKGCMLSISMPEEIHIRLNQTLFKQMIINLIFNAADATQEKGEIKIKAQLLNKRLVLEVHDNGPGIPQELEETIFSPFYTSKENGTGLGLLSVKAFTQEHNGELSVKPSAMGGACFKVSLPIEGERK